MKVGLALVTFIFTIIFATIAIQNNKIARKITTKEFGLDKMVQDKKGVDANESNTTKKGKSVPHITKAASNNNFGKKWDDDFKKEWDSF